MTKEEKKPEEEKEPVHTIGKVSHIHDLVCMKAALGLNNKTIAIQTDYSEQHISKLLKDDKIQFGIKQWQYKLFAKNAKKRFDSMVPGAIDELQKLLVDETVKDTVKLSAIKEILDRGMGRAIQKIEHTDSTINDLYLMLDEMRNKQEPLTIEAECSDVVDAENPTLINGQDGDSIEAEDKEEEKPEEQPSKEWDDWLNDNLGDT